MPRGKHAKVKRAISRGTNCSMREFHTGFRSSLHELRKAYNGCLKMIQQTTPEVYNKLLKGHLPRHNIPIMKQYIHRMVDATDNHHMDDPCVQWMLLSLNSYASYL